MLNTPGMQRKALDTLLDVAREFDFEHGTEFLHYVWENLIKGNFRVYD